MELADPESGVVISETAHDKTLRHAIENAVAALTCPSSVPRADWQFYRNAVHLMLSPRELDAIRRRLEEEGRPDPLSLCPADIWPATRRVLSRRRLWQIATRAAYLRYLAGEVPTRGELEGLRKNARTDRNRIAIFVVGAAASAFCAFDSVLNLVTGFRPPDPALLALRSNQISEFVIPVFSVALLGWCAFYLGTIGRLARGPGQLVRISEAVASGRDPAELLTAEGLPRE